jgi:Flp pilus assembly pilin Flp
MKQRIQQFIESQSGVSAFESALVSRLVVVLIVVSAAFAGPRVSAIYSYLKDQLVLALTQ